MLKLYDPLNARRTLLKRIALDEQPVPPALLAGIERLFGCALTPDQAVAQILEDVRTRGDAGLRTWAEKLDGGAPENLRVPARELQDALRNLPQSLRDALETAAGRIRVFHQAQPVTSWLDPTGMLGQLVRPIRRVGLYVPAGSAPLPSTVLMSAIPAQVAGVSEIVLAAPPKKGTGRIDAAILAAAALLGIDEVYSVGGAQAIGALAYGTATIRPVDKIFGPGNLFVTLAKRRVFGRVGIDGLAGPTETVVIADDSARPAWVAADLLAQSEHDPLAAGILLSPSPKLIEAVQGEVVRQVAQRGRSEIIAASLAGRGGAVLTAGLEEALELANEYAPEHLCLSVRDPWKLLPGVRSAGGVFMGENSCEVLGDYVAGPSHVMPTNGSARFASPLNVLDFVHLVSLVALDEETRRALAGQAAEIARAEGLDAHAYAAGVRQ